MTAITNRQARQFMLLKHGLFGDYRFAGKQGALDFIRQAGCIQFDPIDICGRNADITLQSRVKEYTKAMLAQLLYEDRLLIDYPDKNTAIISVEDWPYFERYRQNIRRRAEAHPELTELMGEVLSFINESGPVCADDINLESDFQWRAYVVWSSGKKLSGSLLEQLYGAGDLIIHHKAGARKYYDLAKRHIPADILNAPEPLPDEFEYKKWRLLRRIGAVGMLWNRASDAFLIPWGGFRAGERNELFQGLLADEKITAITVDGIKDHLYIRSEDMPLMEAVINGEAAAEAKPRCELIAPLDPLIWDRRLINALFGFDYTWEIYTPVEKRKFGHYVLPMLYGEKFIGRVEAVADRKTQTLVVKNIWYENGVKPNKKQTAAIERCLRRFAKFNECKR